jgi:hypothetical protein
MTRIVAGTFFVPMNGAIATIGKILPMVKKNTASTVMGWK